jgi:hypothetical protein
VATLLTYLAQSDFLGGPGPDTSGGFRVSPNAFLILFGVGFGLGMLGHLFKSKTLVAVGIVCIFLSTVLVPIFLQASHR